MDKETVIRLRALLKQGTDLPLRIICDNAMNFDEATEFIVWDDNNSCFYAIRPNTAVLQDTGHAPDVPVEVMTTHYDHIQYIKAAVTKDHRDKILEQLKANGLVTDDNIAVINKYWNKTLESFVM